MRNATVFALGRKRARDRRWRSYDAQLRGLSRLVLAGLVSREAFESKALELKARYRL